MAKITMDQIKQAVESQHGGTAAFVQAVPVHETHNGQIVWDGVVHVFELTGNPRGAFRAYAWSHEREDGEHRVIAILHTPQILGPREAVAAAIVKRARSKGNL